jgi:hypothetical protein
MIEHILESQFAIAWDPLRSDFSMDPNFEILLLRVVVCRFNLLFLPVWVIDKGSR